MLKYLRVRGHSYVTYSPMLQKKIKYVYERQKEKANILAKC